MVESRLMRELRAQAAAEAEYGQFVEFLLIALDEPEVREAVAKAVGDRPLPAPAAPTPQRPSMRGNRTSARGGRRG